MSFFTFSTFFALLKSSLFHPKPWFPKTHHICKADVHPCNICTFPGPVSSSDAGGSGRTCTLPHRFSLDRGSAMAATKEREGYYSDRNEIARERENDRGYLSDREQRDRGYLSDHNISSS